MIGLMAAAACSGRGAPESTTDLIRVGVLPDQSHAHVLELYTPLLEYLHEDTGLRFELIVSKSYDDLSALFSARSVDVAHVGARMFVECQSNAGAVPLVMRDVDLRFTTYFLVRGHDPAVDIAALKGRTLTFGSDKSTSGHLMPRYFLEERGIVPEEFFGAVQYSGTHDRTAYHVRDGVADVGAASALLIESMIRDGRLEEGDVRVLWETPMFPDYVWAVQPALTPEVRRRLRDAFLALTPEQPAHAAILAGLDAGGFLPVNPEDFDMIKSIMARAQPGGAAE